MSMKPVTEDMLAAWSEKYAKSEARRVSELAFSKSEINAVSFSAKENFLMKQKFSVEVKTLPATNQERSGRCWLFAATNVLRERVAQKLELDNFELSQSYLAFWDKFERANLMLENIIATAALPTDDRNVQFILQTGVHDGGQWEMFANIVRKYGVVPKDNYSETYQSSHTQQLNAQLNRALKAEAVRLREMIAAGAAENEVQNEKNRTLGKVYAFLCTCYTEPPKTFDFTYVDKNRAYHTERNMTPLAFAEKYVGDLLEKSVSIINSPTSDKPYHKTFTVRYLGNIVGGKPVVHLNLPMDEFKDAVIRQLKDGKIVWFGSDVGKFGDREKGVWDDKSYDFEATTGLDLAISKENALGYWFSSMNHAMCLTGVDIVDGKPTKWKIENSWGGDKGEKGYYICSDSWFDEYVYQAAVEREYLGSLADCYPGEPKMMEAWDPMGTLAE
ncbi:MAG: C1 family peptidase [Oscillospiraceae bacterium]|nr:C1 family peptidase [Oscillospiraceae bacterium]